MTFQQFEELLAKHAFEAHDQGLDLAGVYVATIRSAAALGRVGLSLPTDEMVRDLELAIDSVSPPESKN